MRSSSWVWLALALGCGGKIVEAPPLDDMTPAEERAASPSPRPSPPPATTDHAAPASVTPLDACEVLCERDARCDTTLPALPVRDGEDGHDCRTRCEKRLSGECGIDDWLLCYAATIDPNACMPLPDECRPAFCAWARCAKQPVSNCD